MDPESVDLDLMALWRAADWAGAFAADGDAAAGDEQPVHAVVDLGSHTVKVLLVEGDNLVHLCAFRTERGSGGSDRSGSGSRMRSALNRMRSRSRE